MLEQQTLDELYELARQSDEAIKLNDALDRLNKNSDFILVIAKGYLVDTALKLVVDKGSSTCTELQEINVDRGLISIGKLQHYLQSIRINADMATKSKEDAYAAITEITHGDK
jgi:hypothetical protein